MRVAVIGAGIAGLASAIDLAHAGFEVTVFERAEAPGGKMREIRAGGFPMDAGPTVFTLRRVFEELFADSGATFERQVRLVPARILARHAWSAHERLDLYADPAESADAIGRFAGAAEARGFVRFATQAKRIYRALESSFIGASRPSMLGLARRMGLAGTVDLLNLRPFSTLWRATSEYFSDPRLRQLFARYATYCGSSPFACPATLMLVAHVEQAGVWYIEGGMHRLAVELAALAQANGATFRYATGIAKIHTDQGRVSGVETLEGAMLPVDAVVSNADNNALAAGFFGPGTEHAVRATPRGARSLSAVTWNLHAPTQGFELAHHSVFFSADYRAEFDDIFRHRRLPRAPTIYVCAQDRRDSDPIAASSERLMCLVNAPAIGDLHLDPAELDSCEKHVFQTLAGFGLQIRRQAERTLRTDPAEFNRLFPGTGGALYGPACHGWKAAFNRASSRSSIPGLYLAGGSTHPGPGVPMAATSGRLAAACLKADYASIVKFRRAVTPGGTWTG